MKSGIDVLDIREMRQSDIPAVFRLVDEQKWGWEELEVRRIFDLDERGSVVADSERGMLGLVTGMAFGKTAFVVHVIVRADWRSKGLGAQLLDAALRQYDSRGVESTELLANPEAEEFYLRTGFRSIEHIAFYSASPENHSDQGGGSNIEGSGYRWVAAADHRNVAEHLSRHLGYDCDDILRTLDKDPPNHALTGGSPEISRGTLLGRSGKDLNGLGPWTMDTQDDAQADEMLRAVIDRMPRKRIDVCIPSSNRTARKVAEEAGFRVVKDGLIRMSRSGKETSPFPKSVFAMGQFGLI